MAPSGGPHGPARTVPRPVQLGRSGRCAGGAPDATIDSSSTTGRDGSTGAPDAEAGLAYGVDAIIEKTEVVAHRPALHYLLG